ncbi:MAG: enoyl-CoA hydratase/isomerase family protein [Proteobacteria bacterium]|nr:enoyl-CoA hydratase/isomerase family protein [Pseudomonadota bacterium]
MTYFDLKKEDSVFILTMINGDKDNTFTIDFFNELNACLDTVEKSLGNTSMVLTSSHPKTWSTGINLDWLMTQSADQAKAFVNAFDLTLIRLALLNLPTIACITGNVYAGAAIMACTFDFKFMREDRGRFCFPEVNIRIPFTETMHDIIDLIPNDQILKELALTGKAIGGYECKEKNVVDEICPQEDLPVKTMEFAKMLAEKDRPTYTMIKHGLKPKVFARKDVLKK